MRVGIDFDAVLADLLPVWLEEYAAQYGHLPHFKPITQADITIWNWHTLTVPECGDKLYREVRHPGIYERVQPVPGAQNVVDAWKQAGYELVLVSSDGASHLECKLAWLDRHFTGMIDEVVVGRELKRNIAERMQLDVLVDDYPKNLIRLPCRGILFRPDHYHYSQRAKMPANVEVAESWTHIAELIARQASSAA